MDNAARSTSKTSALEKARLQVRIEPEVYIFLKRVAYMENKSLNLLIESILDNFKRSEEKKVAKREVV